MNNLSKQIGQQIRQLRKSRGITQEQLAEMAGVHPSYIGRLERAEINTTIDMLDKISMGLGIPVYQLFITKAKGKEKEYLISEINEILCLQNETKLKMIKRVIADIC